MKTEEIDRLCEWIDRNIQNYLGYNSFGSLRVVNPDRLKKELNSRFGELHELPL